ncbi:hypothetical protein [Hymenobacter sp. J193]
MRTDGTLWAWGSNFSDQVGDGSTITRRTAPVQWARPPTGRVWQQALTTP